MEAGGENSQGSVPDTANTDTDSGIESMSVCSVSNTSTINDTASQSTITPSEHAASGTSHYSDLDKGGKTGDGSQVLESDTSDSGVQTMSVDNISDTTSQGTLTPSVSGESGYRDGVDVTIKTMDNKENTFNFSSLGTVQDLRTRVAEWLDQSPTQTNLKFNGKSLDSFSDKTTLVKCGMMTKSTPAAESTSGPTARYSSSSDTYTPTAEYRPNSTARSRKSRSEHSSSSCNIVHCVTRLRGG